MKKFCGIFFALIFSFLFLTACGSKEPPVPTSIEVNGVEYPFTLEDLDLSGMDDLSAFIDNSASFTELKTIELGNTSLPYSDIAALKSAFPAAKVSYTVDILGQEYASDTTELDLTALKHEDVSATAEAVAKLPDLTSIKLVEDGETEEYDPDEDGVTDYVRYRGELSSLPFDDYVALKEAAPQAEVRYCFELFDLRVHTVLTDKLQYKQKDIGDAGLDEFRKVLPYLDHLTYISMDRCGAADEELEKLNQEFPDTKIVWRIFFGPYSCMTDAETLWAMCIYDGQDSSTESLKYCHDLKNLDIGHSEINDLSFLYGTPELEVLIASCGNYGDLTPIGSLKHLKYLEICQSQNNYPKDISAIANCTELEYLNIGCMSGLTDISAVYGLTNLKRLNMTGLYGLTNGFEEEAEKVRQLLPNTEVEALGDIDCLLFGTWRWKDGNETEMYSWIRDVFNYPDADEYAPYRQPKLYSELDFPYED